MSLRQPTSLRGLPTADDGMDEAVNEPQLPQDRWRQDEQVKIRLVHTQWFDDMQAQPLPAGDIFRLSV